ncbi:MAG TPA: glycosyltransferase family 2 protein [Chloroflexia bacterium]|nr:glycosyltransferase family 2 protein [Chloroflexia bacterium]
MLTVFYAYAGYGVIVYCLARLFGHKTKFDQTYRPTVTTLIAAYNEEDCIENKIKNCLEQDYPAELHEIIVASDGSTDRTAEIVQKYADRHPNILLMHYPRSGKMAAVNRAMQRAKGEIIILSDANNMYNREATSNLVRHFADSKVGCVGGEKRIIKSNESPSSRGEGLYWKYEAFLKRCDSQFYSMVGAPGEIYAIRRHLYNPPPNDCLLDDFIVSMEIAQKGYRVLYEPEAISTEYGSASLRDEFRRRSRIFCGGYQSIARMPGLLDPRYGRLWFQYISHRVLRWAVTPFLIPLIFLLNLLLARKSPFYSLLLVAQVVLYSLGFKGLRQLDKTGACPRLFYIPAYFIFLQIAELAGFKRWVTQRQTGLWDRSKRAGTTSEANLNPKVEATTR